MASQGEREPGVLEMDVGLVESMAQDESPEQEMLNEQEQFPPQPNPEPEMGAAAAAVYDTSPPPLRQNPPILAESAQPSVLDMILQAMNEMKTNAQEMNNKMKANLKENAKEIKEELKEEIKNKMDAHTKTLR